MHPTPHFLCIGQSSGLLRMDARCLKANDTLIITGSHHKCCYNSPILVLPVVSRKSTSRGKAGPQGTRDCSRNFWLSVVPEISIAGKTGLNPGRGVSISHLLYSTSLKFRSTTSPLRMDLIDRNVAAGREAAFYFVATVN
jgi:hypothetical protein